MRRFRDHERELPAALGHAADGATRSTRRIEETHLAIAGRVFRATPHGPDGQHHLGRANHFTLLHTPRLNAALSTWLFGARPALEIA